LENLAKRSHDPPVGGEYWLEVRLRREIIINVIMSEVKKGILTNPIYFDATVKMLDNAHNLRLANTKSENILWQKLRNRKLNGFKFRRQHPINGFVADFYCHEARLVIELDGKVHETKKQKERDENRTIELQRLGLEVLRIKNDEVFFDIESAISMILKCINK
jgi:very-short-patch-repair endonuclease